VAAAEETQTPSLVAGQCQGEARGGDAVGRVQRGGEVGVPEVADVEAEQRGSPVVKCAEAAEELWVGENAAPALANEGGAWEGGRERREAKEDLAEEVIIVRQGRCQRRRGGAAAAHGTLAHLDGNRKEI